MAFFALPVPGDLQISITEGLASLKTQFPDIQWVHPEDYHLTLRFLGGLQAQAVRGLLEAMQAQFVPFAPFTLNLQALASFPPHRDRGVLWIAIEALPPELIALQEGLENAAQALGFEAERRAFTPHLTIGRFKSRDTEALMQVLPDFAERAWGPLICREYVLMKRRYGARDNTGHPLYEVLTRFSV